MNDCRIEDTGRKVLAEQEIRPSGVEDTDQHLCRCGSVEAQAPQPRPGDACGGGEPFEECGPGSVTVTVVRDLLNRHRRRVTEALWAVALGVDSHAALRAVRLAGALSRFCAQVPVGRGGEEGRTVRVR
jgi:hypothetical protein